MSFFKSFILAICATIFLTYVLGSGFMSLFDINVMIDDHHLEPLQAISISALVVVAMILIALAIILSVFGGVIFLTIMIFGSIAMALLGVFWPVILVACVIYAMTRDKQPKMNEYRH